MLPLILAFLLAGGKSLDGGAPIPCEVKPFTALTPADQVLGLEATEAVAEALTRQAKYRILRKEDAPLGPPTVEAAEVVTPGEWQRRRVVAGEVWASLAPGSKARNRSEVSIRVMVYDGLSGLPLDGVIVRRSASNDPRRRVGALRSAARDAIGRIEGHPLRVATMLTMCVGIPLINQGSRIGFRAGTLVHVVRQGVIVGQARVGIIEPDQAELVPEPGWSARDFAPGDRVFASFVPPALPSMTKDTGR